jgi:ribosome-binding protein aMBF1 (putative translation factor)
MPRRIVDAEILAARFGEAFAKAFATFVRELGRTQGEVVMRRHMPAEERVNDKAQRPDITLERIEDLPPELRAEAEESLSRYRNLVQRGKLTGIELTPDIPAQLAGSRLRRALKERGIKQRDLAKRLDVSPAVVSRVLKNPDRSMVATLRRIADALGVELRELID